jgi:hypothetical protein
MRLLLLCCVSEHGKKNFDLFFEDSKQFVHLWDYDYEWQLEAIVRLVVVCEMLNSS